MFLRVWDPLGRGPPRAPSVPRSSLPELLLAGAPPGWGFSWPGFLLAGTPPWQGLLPSQCSSLPMLLLASAPLSRSSFWPGVLLVGVPPGLRSSWPGLLLARASPGRGFSRPSSYWPVLSCCDPSVRLLLSVFSCPASPVWLLLTRACCVIENYTNNMYRSRALKSCGYWPKVWLFYKTVYLVNCGSLSNIGS